MRVFFYVALFHTLVSRAVGTGEVVINEVVCDPQHDWSSVNYFNDQNPSLSVQTTDEWIELYIKENGLDLRDWLLELRDTDTTSGDLSESGAFTHLNYISSSGGTFTNTKKGDFLVLGNPKGTGNTVNNSIIIVLKNKEGILVDSVGLGTKGDAPYGAASGAEDESISRILNGQNTNDDAFDFIHTVASPGEANHFCHAIGQRGDALYVESLDGSIMIPDASLLSKEGSMSIELWIKTASSNGSLLTKYGDEDRN